MKEIIGKKLGMTRVFGGDGEVIAVSVIEAGPCVVVARRTVEKNGYQAVQVGFEGKRKKLLNKSELAYFEKNGIAPARYLREIGYDGDLNVGDLIKVGLFKKGERVDVTGVSKGLGFQGVIRRHNFGGGPKTHGQSDRQRAPGSVGASSYPSRVYKGQRMAGKMGRDKKTIAHLEVVQVLEEQNLLLVKGAVPGKKGTLLRIRRTNKVK